MKLFLSFTNMMFRVMRNELSELELNTGLYYFGCGRPHLFDAIDYASFRRGSYDAPFAELLNHLAYEGAETPEALEAAAKPLIERIRSLVLKAEAEGRCGWSRDNPRPGRVLLALLRKNGMEVNGRKLIGIQRERFHVGHGGEFGRNYPATQDILETLGVPVECIR